jgi:hypothetical protein
LFPPLPSLHHSHTLLTPVPVPTHYIPPLTISLLPNCSLLASPSSLPLIFPLSFSPHRIVAWSASPTCGNLPWSSTGLHLPPPPFSLSLSIYYQLLYWFLLIVVCSSFLIYFLSPLSPPFTQPCSLLYPDLHHTLELGYNFLPPIVLFQIIHLFIKYFLSFLPPTLSCESSPVPCYHTVRIPSITDRLCPAALTTTLPSIQPLATPYWLSPHYWDIFTTHTLPCIYSVLGLQAFFWILEPWRWDMIGCPEISVRSYH